ncbi:hydroxylase desaturase asaB [Hyphodiscus hymeniophilus]|uniref:Hydroxylase desaturase asaB n=1 Tax=Hyphodiscus hymeniophilus TaxID=353542 RepID=A0A9P6VR28_9HELO|nr:hydroxylase desaturase asaB [Hyphodiscus hymeniophilus]
MTTAAPLNAIAAPNLSPSARLEHDDHVQPEQQSAKPNTYIPRGDTVVTLNYFRPPEDGSIPFQQAGDNVDNIPAGQVLRNFGDFDVKVPITDIRGHESEYTLDEHAFEVIENVPESAEKEFVDDESIKQKYYPESATARVRHHLPEEAEKLLQGRFRIINVWRPLNGPVQANPLGFAATGTLRDEDLIPIEHRYPDRTGETAGIVYSPNQKWHYLSGMKNDERLFLECFDSEASKPGTKVRGGRVPHTAFRDERTPEDAIGRESIEVRALVFGP